MTEEQKSLERIIISNELKDTPTLIFLYTSLQQSLEIIVEYVYSDDIKKKDKAVNILKEILESKFVQQFRTVNPIIFNVLGGLINFYRGQAIYTSEDQLNCETEFSASLTCFNNLPNQIKLKYLNYIQEIYNSLGIILHNKGQIKKGLQYLGLAEKIYTNFIEVINNPDEIVNYNFRKYLVDDYRKDNEKHTYHFFVDGVISQKHLERNYTLTIFYIAQAYQRLNFKNKAAGYCSLTLKRQIDLNEYDLKDAVVNCINLADFYVENMHFAQTEYILISALSLLPQDTKVKKRLRASVQMQLGRYFVERLKFALLQMKKDWFIANDVELHSKVK